MVISIIACIAQDGAIGFQNRLLYHIPEDLHRFRDLTTGHTIIMGRKTYDSLPHGALPHRRNIVLSQSRKEISGCETYPSLGEAIDHCKGEGEIFVIGGESVYRQAIDMASRLYLTVVEDTSTNADAYFPPIDAKHWETEHEEKHAYGNIQYTYRNLRRHESVAEIREV